MSADEQPVRRTPLLNDSIKVPKSKDLSCSSCRLFQYAPCFKKRDRDAFKATLDPLRFDMKNRSYLIPGKGDEGAEVMAVLDVPTKAEDKTGEAGSGGANLTILRNAKECGIDAKAWYFTHAVKCHDPKRRVDFKTAAYCTRFLADEVSTIKPRVIVAFGPLAFQLLTGKPGADLTHFLCVPQKAVVAGHPCVVYPMMSPGFVSKNDYLIRRYLGHFDQLKAFLRGDEDAGVREDTSNYRIIVNVEDAIKACRKMIVAGTEKGRVIDMDIETSSLNPFKAGTRLSVVSFSCSTKVGYAVMMNHDQVPWTDADRKRFVKHGLKPLMTNPAVKLRWHNGKFDNKWFPLHAGFWPRDPVEDTMLTHYAIDENMEHGLKPLAALYTDMGDYDAELDRVLAAQTYEDRPRYDLVDYKLLGKYAAQDPVATRKLAIALRPLAAEQGPAIEALAYRVMPAFSATLTRLEFNGVAIDRKFAQETLIPFMTGEAKRSYDTILSQPTVRQFIRDGEAGKRAAMKRPKPIELKQYFTFSLNSPKQLQTLLFDEKYYGHEPTVVSDSGAPSTDKEVMNDLAAAGSPIAKAIIDWRTDEKMVSSFGQPIVDRLLAQGNDLLHGDFLLHGTVTGRLSSRNPNCQNISNKANAIVKRMFVSRYTDGCILQIDFSQIELRLLAGISGDPSMLKAYADGKDLHTLTACMIFGMTEDEFKALPKDEQKRRRTIAKRVNFGIAYGIGAPGIQSTLKSDGVNISEEEARGYLDRFAESYPRVTKWIERVENSTMDDEFSRSLFGRRRRLEQVRSKLNDVQARAKRQAVNHVIQSTAGDMTNTALTLFDQEVCLRRGDSPDMILPTIDRRAFEVDERWSRVHLCLQVHDMIGVDCPVDMVGVVTERLLDTMQRVVDLAPLVWGEQVKAGLKCLHRVPILAEAEVGPNWRDAYGVKTAADIDLAMFIAKTKNRLLDADPLAKWGDDQVNAAKAQYKAAA